MHTYIQTNTYTHTDIHTYRRPFRHIQTRPDQASRQEYILAAIHPSSHTYRQCIHKGIERGIQRYIHTGIHTYNHIYTRTDRDIRAQ